MSVVHLHECCPRTSPNVSMTLQNELLLVSVHTRKAKGAALGQRDSSTRRADARSEPGHCAGRIGCHKACTSGKESSRRHGDDFKHDKALELSVYRQARLWVQDS